ncbi:hypothetical protein F0562_001488 [Nyssa sinensis]|uniref:Uncharacterized protein n=1 Tax=Nyssa sinensis TaxID=561372 RepID=A0A5J5C4P2_9ASTE|nr:hypothetical protein F0562_001488 [Nyssa sinensis]
MWGYGWMRPPLWSEVTIVVIGAFSVVVRMIGNVGHRCRKLFVIEACHEDDDSDMIMEEDDVVEDGVEAQPEISFHAISRTHTLETMRVNGSIGHIATIVLVDSGSTHNFINAMLAKKVGLQPNMGGKFEVVVA